MQPAAGEIAADLDSIAPPRCGRQPAPGRLHPPRGDAGDSSTPPPTLHSIRERSTARRAGSMRTERRRGDCTGHGAHLTAAGVDAGQDAAAPMGTARPMGSTPPAPLRAATHTTPPALHSYIGEDSTARRPHYTPHTAAPAMLHPAPPRWGQRTAAPMGTAHRRRGNRRRSGQHRAAPMRTTARPGEIAPAPGRCGDSLSPVQPATPYL